MVVLVGGVVYPEFTGDHRKKLNGVVHPEFTGDHCKNLEMKADGGLRVKTIKKKKNKGALSLRSCAFYLL